MLTVSARLNAILSLLRPCRLLADVGTDHGLIPICAVQRGIAEHAIAADLRAPPLAVARQNVERAELQGRVTLVQGDGLLPLSSHPVEALVIAGMSGALMVRMFQAAVLPASLSQLVLSPNQDVEQVRHWARTHGWHLADESMIEERAQYFPICSWVRGQGDDPAYAQGSMQVSELELLGPLLLSRMDPTALRFCQLQRARLAKLVERGVETLSPELSLWQRACALLER